MNIIDQLLQSEEPCIRYKVKVNVLDEDIQSPSNRKLQKSILSSPRVTALLADRQGDDSFRTHPYSKWYGAHWVLATLADLGYPQGDESLVSLRNKVTNWLLSEQHIDGVSFLEGRARRCGSQEGNALYSILTLGIDDGSSHRLAENLLRWQWPDGGWNCDKKPEASKSSFHETILPLRSLSLYNRLCDSKEAGEAAKRAAEVFLGRRMFRSLRDGSIMKAEFLNFHYPCYWHYDILCGLKVMAESGFINDPRCSEALDYLESKRLPNGGFSSGTRYYNKGKPNAYGRRTSGYSPVGWGPHGAMAANEFVTADALYVLKTSGRLEVK